MQYAGNKGLDQIVQITQTLCTETAKSDLSSHMYRMAGFSLFAFAQFEHFPAVLPTHVCDRILIKIIKVYYLLSFIVNRLCKYRIMLLYTACFICIQYDLSENLSKLTFLILLTRKKSFVRIVDLD